MDDCCRVPIAQGARGPLVVPEYGCTCKELAEKVVASPQDYSLKHCGVHIEIQPGSPAYGKMICDLDSDQKFEKKNAYLVM